MTDHQRLTESLHTIRDIATQLQTDSSTHDPRQRKIARIIDIVDESTATDAMGVLDRISESMEADDA